MFNLVKYRKLFVIFSLLIIVPGFISLLINGLNLGIDFTNGASVNFRPQRAFASSDQVVNYLKQFNLESLKVTLGNDTSQGKTAWVRLNTQIDDNVQNTIADRLKSKFGLTKDNISPRTIPATNGQPAYTLLTLTGFKDAPKVSDIQDALKDLPKTSDPTKGPATAVATPTATAATPTAGATTPTATSTTPTASATTPTATASTPTPTPTVSVKVTPTPTPAVSNPANIDVKVADVALAQTTQTFEILTHSTITTTTQATDKKAISVPQIQAAFLNQGGPYLQLISNSQVSPAVAAETTKDAILAVLAASAFILLYIWFAFRKVAKALRYAVCAILALLHDVLVVLGVFSILGKLFGIQIDALFITALLTVVGFSVHDTIVVFDRIRENMQRRTNESFEQVVNASLVQTMARSLNTSLTVLFTLLALTLFTGINTDIHTFTLTLLIGIFSGTYSSIFNASMLLVMWDQGEWGFQYLGGGDGRERPLTKREVRDRERELARTRG